MGVLVGVVVVKAKRILKTVEVWVSFRCSLEIEIE